MQRSYKTSTAAVSWLRSDSTLRYAKCGLQHDRLLSAFFTHGNFSLTVVKPSKLKRISLWPKTSVLLRKRKRECLHWWMGSWFVQAIVLPSKKHTGKKGVGGQTWGTRPNFWVESAQGTSCESRVVWCCPQTSTGPELFPPSLWKTSSVRKWHFL